MTGVRQRTKLAAVNQVLRKLGRDQVTALRQTHGSRVVEDIIDQVSDDLQNHSFEWNTEEEVSLFPSAKGWIHIPDDLAHLDPESVTSTITQRGLRLYDRDKTKMTYVMAESPTNLLNGAFDLTDAAWSTSGTPVITSTPSVMAPFGDPSETQLLADDDNGVLEYLYDSINVSSLTDGTTYVISGYVRNGPDQGSQGGQIVLVSDSGATTEGTISIDLTNEPPLTFTSGTPRALGVGPRVYNQRVVVLPTSYDGMDTGGVGSKRASWCYFEALWTYDSTYTSNNVWFRISPSSTASDTGVDAFFWGLRFAPVADNVLKFTVRRVLDFEDLPPVAKAYVIYRSAREYSDVVKGSRDLRRQLMTDEEEAWCTMQNANTQVNYVDLRYGNLTVAKTIGARPIRVIRTGLRRY